MTPTTDQLKEDLSMILTKHITKACIIPELKVRSKADALKN